MGKFLSYFKVLDELEQDSDFADRALNLFKEFYDDSTTRHSAVSALLHHWLLNKELIVYRFGKPIPPKEIIEAMVNADDDAGSNHEALHRTWMVEPNELADKLSCEGFILPKFLLELLTEKTKDSKTRNQAAQALGIQIDGRRHAFSDGWPELLPITTIAQWQFPDDAETEQEWKELVKLAVRAGKLPKRYIEPNYMAADNPPLCASDVLWFLTEQGINPCCHVTAWIKASIQNAGSYAGENNQLHIKGLNNGEPESTNNERLLMMGRWFGSEHNSETEGAYSFAEPVIHPPLDWTILLSLPSWTETESACFIQGVTKVQYEQKLIDSEKHTLITFFKENIKREAIKRTIPHQEKDGEFHYHPNTAIAWAVMKGFSVIPELRNYIEDVIEKGAKTTGKAFQLEKLSENEKLEYSKLAAWAWVDAVYILQGYKPIFQLYDERVNKDFPEIAVYFLQSIDLGNIGKEKVKDGLRIFIDSPANWQKFWHDYKEPSSVEFVDGITKVLLQKQAGVANFEYWLGMRIWTPEQTACLIYEANPQNYHLIKDQSKIGEFILLAKSKGKLMAMTPYEWRQFALEHRFSLPKQIMDIEKPVEESQAEPVADDGLLTNDANQKLKISQKYIDRKACIDAWLLATQFNTSLQLKIIFSQVKSWCQVKEHKEIYKDLWDITEDSFRTEVWQPYCKETGIKSKPGRPRGLR